MTDAPDNFDVIVVGGGPGGYVAAIRAAQLGMRAACVEREPALGGTCLRVGCIPSKALLDSSEHYEMARSGLKEHGVLVGDVRLDLDAMLKRKDRVVRGLTGGVASLFKKHGIEWVRGHGRLLGGGRVGVDGSAPRTLSAPHILLATGSQPVALPTLPFDGSTIVSSTEALAFSAVPRRLLVVGAGAIGLELGSVWARLGAAVRVIELADRIVPLMDAELGAELKKLLEKQGLSITLGARAVAVEVGGGVARLTLAHADGGSETVEADKVLVAVGRRPCLDDLGLDVAGVQLDARGRVRVDERWRSNVPGIYAVGDVVDGPMLAHKASEEGIACIECIAGQSGHVNAAAIPNVVYTWPELAGVGQTEEQARAAGFDVGVGRFPFMANGRARAAHERDGMVKVVRDRASDRVLGVHILGPRASELIAEATLALEFGAASEDIARTSHAHPTLSEALREAALDADGRVIHL